MAYSIPYEALEEATTARQYKLDKEESRRQAAIKDEDRYQKRFGDTKTRTTLRGDDKLPNTTSDTYTSGAPNHMNVRDNEKLKAEKKQAHYDKSNEEWQKAHQDIAKEANKREFRRYWNDKTVGNDNYLRTMDNFAYAADAKARHDRRHTKHESFGIFESVEFI